MKYALDVSVSLGWVIPHSSFHSRRYLRHRAPPPLRPPPEAAGRGAPCQRRRRLRDRHAGDAVNLPADIDRVKPAEIVLAKRVEAIPAQDSQRVHLRRAFEKVGDRRAVVAERVDAAADVVAKDGGPVERLAVIDDVAAPVDVAAGDRGV